MAQIRKHAARSVRRIRIAFGAGLAATAILLSMTPATVRATGASLPSFNAEYFPNQTLSGVASLVTTEPFIDHDWKLGGPTPLLTDNFSARWTGNFPFKNGVYAFVATADDGIRVFLDGVAIIDEWHGQPPTTYQSIQTMTAGVHEVKVEYFEGTERAIAQVSWAARVAKKKDSFEAQYFPNETLSGTPSLVADEPFIDHDWKLGGPSGLPTDGFSARWAGDFKFKSAVYSFLATADDGIRVYLDGTKIIDAWSLQPPSTYQAIVNVHGGEHEVKVEYYEHTERAIAQLSWKAKIAHKKDDFDAEYFPNETLSGSPALKVEEHFIDHNWQLGAPAGLPSDGFSARWEGDFKFAPGVYAFIATADDGIRVFVDDVAIINEWHGQPPTTYQALHAMSAGEHDIRVEYFEHTERAVAQVAWRPMK